MAAGTGGSVILRAELIAAGVPEPDAGDVSSQAHHIVERGDPAAAPARGHLNDAGIEWDSAANGVFLPSVSHDEGGGATIHLGSHKGEYATIVNRAVAAAAAPPNPVPIVDVLHLVRVWLLTGSAGINSGVDTDYDDASGGGQSLTASARAAGLPV